MQDNAIIIKLEDGDITTAQDDPDIEGIIHIPSIEYDHCVQEVQVPGQSFFNGLYLNVQDLDIGGSGLPIIIDSVLLTPYSNYINTWDFQTLSQNQQFNLTNQALLIVREGDDNYFINYIMTYGVNRQITVQTSTTSTIRYYLFNESTANNSMVLFFSGNDQVLTMMDNINNDIYTTTINVRKQFIEFNWLTN